VVKAKAANLWLRTEIGMLQAVRCLLTVVTGVSLSRNRSLVRY